jgi:protein arginine kinase
VGFAQIVGKELTWLDGTGPQAEIVLSSRVRLARNLKGHRFPAHCALQELSAIHQEVTSRVRNLPSFREGWQIEMAACSGQQRQYLLERHLVSPDLIRFQQNRALLLASGLDRVVMVNEEDHVRLQVFRSGFEPVAACHDAIALDTEMEEVLEYAYSDDLGYLTSCPTNVGTGFRLSVLVHLPALVLADEIERVLNSLRQLQFSVRGLFGEGSAVRGALFQVSNLVTLGRSEETLTQDFSRHVAKVVQYEDIARRKLLERDGDGLRDLTHRSLSILRGAHLMTSQEAFDRLSHVRMGVSLGIIPPIPIARLNQALVEMQPAHVQVAAGRDMKGRERAAARAAYLRELFA